MSALQGRGGAGRGVVRRAARGDCYHKEAGHVATWHVTGGWDWAEVTPRHTAPASSHTPGPPPSS